MKKSDALKQQRHAANELQLALINKAKAENRDFTDAENGEFDTRKADMEALDAQINRALEMEAVEARAAAASATFVPGNDGEAKEKRKIQERFSLNKAIRTVTEGNELDGAEKEVNEIGMQENRSAGVSTGQNVRFSLPISMMRAAAQTKTEDSGEYGGMLVQNAAPRVIEGLNPKLFLEELGATFLTGLVGDVPMPVANAYAMSFVAETATVTPVKNKIEGPILKAKRAAGAVDISNQLIMQSSIDAEMMVRNQILRGFTNVVQSAAINGAGGVAPLGILGLTNVNVSAQASAAAATWARIVELQALIEEDNATDQRLGYLMHPKLKAALKQITKDAGSGRFLFEGGFIDGIQASSSSLVPVLDASGTAVYPLIYGDFSQLFIGSWGSLGFVVDPYSAAPSNCTRIVLNTYADAVVANEKAFAKNALLTA
jgi:HK97 family phage major capsid protein